MASCAAQAREAGTLNAVRVLDAEDPIDEAGELQAQPAPGGVVPSEYLAALSSAPAAPPRPQGTQNRVACAKPWSCRRE